MTRKSDSLDRLSIGNPCTEDWEAMTGNQQKRFCQECNKNVYNFSAMTRDEIAAVVARFEGRLCARIERDASGAIITETTPAAPQLISRRVSPVAAVLVTALLGLGGNALAMTANKTAAAAVHSQSGKDDSAPQPQGATATLSGTVTDPQGAVIAGAIVTLINEKTSAPVGSAISNDEGTYHFASLAEGVYTVRFRSQGFKIAETINVEVRAGAAVRTDASLEVAASTGLSGVVAAAPQPLRLLHQGSDLIVVARIGHPTLVKASQDNRQMKTTLEVTSVIKGKNKSSKITLYYWGWGDGQQLPGDAKNGDAALIFLKAGEQKDGYELTDTSSEHSLKKLSAADLSVYQQRLEELNAMSQSKHQDAAAIVDWLVRCAEQPVTRWEGVYELASTVGNDDEDQDDQPDKDNDEGEAAEAQTMVNQTVASAAANPTDAPIKATGSTDSQSIDQARFGKMLSEEQKNRLKALLFNTDKLAESDIDLVELVQHWKDERFVPFLIDQLRRDEANPLRMAANLMGAIAAKMDDDEVTALADAYTNEAPYGDLDEEKNSDDKTEAAGNKEAGTEASVAPNTKAAEAAAARQKRSEMVHQFIALVEKKQAK